MLERCQLFLHFLLLVFLHIMITGIQCYCVIKNVYISSVEDVYFQGQWLKVKVKVIK